uniref:Large ribosomal subunit protein mL51 n=1 Tax=Phallusia mammillata TaxID=59560 RepID=A0A6F9DLX2_9ASCI|nr:39S ribosomal protein L51, mitochondrial-like [Phallusia mammillata]
MLLKTLLQTCAVKDLQIISAAFSTSSISLDKNISFRRRWVTAEKWEKRKTSTGKIPWQPNVPYRHTKDEFSETGSHEGMYDYLAILGDDVTLQPKLFCKGPAHVMGHGASELNRLLRKRQMLGDRMHITDLDACNKRIRFLVRLQQRKRGF